MAKKRKKVEMVLVGKKGHGRTYSIKHKIPKDFGKNKNYVTLDELQDKTFGKKGTPKRDKFEKKFERDTKKEIIKEISLKNIPRYEVDKIKIKINSTPINKIRDLLIKLGFKDMVLQIPKSEKVKKSDIHLSINGKKSKKKFNEANITQEDLKGYSLGEMLTKSYGKKGTKKREEAEKRINEKAKNLVNDNKLKEQSEKQKNNDSTKLGSLMIALGLFQIALSGALISKGDKKDKTKKTKVAIAKIGEAVAKSAVNIYKATGVPTKTKKVSVKKSKE